MSSPAALSDMQLLLAAVLIAGLALGLPMLMSALKVQPSSMVSKYGTPLLVGLISALILYGMQRM